MKQLCCKPLLGFCIALATAVCPCGARGDFVVNGNFSTGPGNLGGWTTSDASAITASGGVATLTEDKSSDYLISLSQTFTIPSGATSLQFTIVRSTTDPAEKFVPPPFFSADLLNPLTGDSLGDSLVPFIPSSTDYYAQDLTPSGTVTTASGVTVTAGPGNSMIVALALPAELANQQAELVLTLFQSGDPNQTNASISISHVTGLTTGGNNGGSGGGGPVATPEPSSIVLLSTGAVVLAGRVWRSRRRSKKTG